MKVILLATGEGKQFKSEESKPLSLVKDKPILYL